MVFHIQELEDLDSSILNIKALVSFPTGIVIYALAHLRCKERLSSSLVK